MSTSIETTSEFDRDTAVTLRTPGVYDAYLSAGWTIISAVNGGYLLSLLGRALGEHLPHPDPFTISAHYLTPSTPGPAVIRTETVRTGRTLSTGQASLVQYDADGAEVERIRVLASYGDLDTLTDDVRTAVGPRPSPRSSSVSAPPTAPGRRSPAPPRSPTGSTSGSTRPPSAGPSAPPRARERCAAGSASPTAASPTRCRCC